MSKDYVTDLQRLENATDDLYDCLKSIRDGKILTGSKDNFREAILEFVDSCSEYIQDSIRLSEKI